MLLVGMLDWNHPAGPVTGGNGPGPTQQSIATLAGVSVRWVKAAEAWLANPRTVHAEFERQVRKCGQPAVRVRATRDVPADPRGRAVQGGKRVPWTRADGLRTWPPFIQVFPAEVVPGGGGGRRRRVCVHPLFYSASPRKFKACLELPPWAEVDITKHDIGKVEGHEPTRDELLEMFNRDSNLGLINGELSSPFQPTDHTGEIDE